MGLLSRMISAVSGTRQGRLGLSAQFEAEGKLIAAAETDAKGQIYIGTKKGMVECISLKADLLWSFYLQEKRSSAEEMFLDPEASSSISAQPRIADINSDRRLELFVGSETGKLVCFTEDGKKKWEFSAKGPIRSRPDFDSASGTIIFGSTDKRVYCLDKNGSMKLNFDAKAPVESGVTCHKGKCFFGNDNGDFFCISSEGKLVWQAKTDGKIIATPTVGRLFGDEREHVLIGSFDRKMYAFEMDGKELWSFSTEGRICSDAALADVNEDGKLEVFFGSCDNMAYALTSEGQRMWTFETDFWVVARPLVFDLDNDGNYEVVIASYDEFVYVLDARGYYSLDFLPGVSGVAQQSGHFAEVLTYRSGENAAKLLWKLRLDGMGTGLAAVVQKQNKYIIASTNTGKLD